MSAGFHRLGSKAKDIGYSASALLFSTAQPPAGTIEHHELMTDPAPVAPVKLDAGAFEPGPSKEFLRAQSLAANYTGDECTQCNNFTMVRNGTCLKCDTCGATTGCS